MIRSNEETISKHNVRIKRLFTKPETTKEEHRENINSSRSEVTNRVVFGLITWFAGPGKSSPEYVLPGLLISVLAIVCTHHFKTLEPQELST